MKEIELTQGLKALVDDEDYEELNKYNWHARKIGNTYYAARKVGPAGHQATVYMHRVLLGFPDCEVDHRDRNGLNNQRVNLRQATKQQQQFNTGPRPNNRTGVKGVSRLKSGRYLAQITASGHGIRLGTFATLDEARQAYQAAAAKYHGEYAAS